MVSSLGAFSRHALVPRRFPGRSLLAEVSRVRMDYPSYPVNIVHPPSIAPTRRTNSSSCVYVSFCVMKVSPFR
jgi:hypothetical protein